MQMKTENNLPLDAGLEQVIRFYSDMVYRLAFARTGTSHDADDVYEEVFLRLLKKKPKFHSEEHRRAWLIRVTINSSNTILTDLWRKRTQELPEDLPFQEPEDYELYSSLKQLPAKYRSVIHLFYYEDMSVEEISRLLNRKASTVRTQLTRAREQLRQLLKEEDYDF